VHHPGLDIPAISCSEEGRPPGRLLAVGSFEKAKGFDDLLQAVSLLRRRGLDVEVDLVGDGPRAGALRRMASTLGIEAATHFRGWLPFEGVQKSMREATLLVHPSIGLGDAVPTVIKEAMAVGTPVVASCVAGIPELLQDGRCGVLVPPRSPARLSEAVGDLLKDETRRRHLARAARTFAEETFDLWRNGRRLAGILRGTRRAAAGEAA
jgi:colanic acid/amylovoran biosynthesis glycosyltransferase